MAKFIQVQSPDNHSYYINVETIKYVAQNAKTADLSAIYFVGEHHLPIGESQPVLLVELVPWRTRPTSSKLDRRILPIAQVG